MTGTMRMASMAAALAFAALMPTHAQAKSCKQVTSCEEAVELWCGGYSRADGDNDGIPCENVCSTREQVEQIIKRIGC